MAKDNVAEFTMSLKHNKYKDSEWDSLVGSFGVGGNRRILVSINCDSSGRPVVYESKDGKGKFVYAKAVRYTKTKGDGNGKRELRL